MQHVRVGSTDFGEVGLCETCAKTKRIGLKLGRCRLAGQASDWHVASLSHTDACRGGGRSGSQGTQDDGDAAAQPFGVYDWVEQEDWVTTYNVLRDTKTVGIKKGGERTSSL